MLTYLQNNIYKRLSTVALFTISKDQSQLVGKEGYLHKTDHPAPAEKEGLLILGM